MDTRDAEDILAAICRLPDDHGSSPRPNYAELVETRYGVEWSAFVGIADALIEIYGAYGDADRSTKVRDGIGPRSKKERETQMFDQIMDRVAEKVGPAIEKMAQESADRIARADAADSIDWRDSDGPRTIDEMHDREREMFYGLACPSCRERLDTSDFAPDKGGEGYFVVCPKCCANEHGYQWSTPQRALRAWREMCADGLEKRVVKWDIWREGYIANGDRSGAQLLGTVVAATFKEACDAWGERIETRANYAPSPQPTYWGCRLFSNEADASKAFGGPKDLDPRFNQIFTRVLSGACAKCRYPEPDGGWPVYRSQGITVEICPNCQESIPHTRKEQC